jgi:hypothetical protein
MLWVCAFLNNLGFIPTLVLLINCCYSSFQDMNRIFTVVLVLYAGYIGGSTKSWHWTLVMFTCWIVISTINAGFEGIGLCIIYLSFILLNIVSILPLQVLVVFSGILSWRWVSMPQKLLFVLNLYCSSWIDCLKTTIACMIILVVYTMIGCKLFQLLICFLTVSPGVISSEMDDINWFLDTMSPEL